MQCGTWQCPACGARRAFDAYSVLAPAIAEWGALGEGQDVWLFSPTVRHTRDESIATVNDRLYDAWDNFTESEDWRHWKDANAVRAVVRCYDDTISLDNFHPHFHVLLFVSDCPTLLHPSRSNRATRRRMLRERVEDLLPAWTRACVAAGMPLALTRDEEPELPELRADLGDVAPLDPDVPDWGRRPARAGTWGRKSSRDARSGRSSWEEHALQLQNGDRAAKYVVKWGLAAEASRGDKKDKSHRALLRAYVDGDLRAGARYREWADATYKRHFVTGLSDVRKLVELSQEMIDAHQRERRELIDKEKRERGEPVRAPRANLRMTITPYLFKAALAIGWGDVFVLVEGAEDARLDARAELDRALIECAYRRERVRGPP